MKTNKATFFTAVLAFGIVAVASFWYANKNPLSQIQQSQDGQKTATTAESSAGGVFSFAVQADPHMSSTPFLRHEL